MDIPEQTCVGLPRHEYCVFMIPCLSSVCVAVTKNVVVACLWIRKRRCCVVPCLRCGDDVYRGWSAVFGRHIAQTTHPTLPISEMIPMARPTPREHHQDPHQDFIDT